MSPVPALDLRTAANDYAGQVVLSLFRGLIVVPARKPSLREIAELVAERYDLTLEELRGPSHRPHIAHPRQDAMAISYATGEWSNGQIGLYYGGRHYSTVMHARKEYAKRLGAPLAMAAE